MMTPPNFQPPQVPPSREHRLRDFREKMDPNRGARKTLALCLLIFGAGFPAMRMTGFFDLLPDLGMDRWMLISVISGAATGAIFYPDWKYWYGGVSPGALAGPSVLLGVYLYTRGRQQIWNVEVVAVGMLAALPAVGLYYLIMRTLVLRDPGPQPE